MTSSNPCTTLVVVDSSVDGYRSLISSVSPQAQVIVLDPDYDGVEQITEFLSAFKGIESLHILSHGDDGQLQLGTSQLSWQTLARYGQQLQSWGKALAHQADILLYGCQVAAGTIGQQFVRQIAQLTGANIAASTDLTGHASLGGNWVLKFTTGVVRSPLAFQPEAMAAYPGVLAVVFNETFTGADVQNRPWLFGVDASTTGQDQPYLTARPIPTASTGGLQGNQPGSVPDAIGNGTLRLTSAKPDQAAFVVYNAPILATGGLTIKFDLFSYGGTGADGISFFLIDGAASPTRGGAYGGSLGYAQKLVEGIPGITGGYLGIGFDEFGNFSTSVEPNGVQRPTPAGVATRVPDSIAVRGSAASGYAFLTGSGTLPFSIDNTAPGATRENSKRTVQVDLTPTGRLTIQIDGNNDGDFNDAGERPITNFDVTRVNGAVPRTFKLGFASGTGDSTNIHEVRNLLITTNDLPQAKDASATVAPRQSVRLAGLSATDSDGTIARYTISTVPAAVDGTLFLGNPNAGGTRVTAGQTLSPAQVTQLFFQASSGFDGGSFTYTATDDDGGTDPTPATVALRLTNAPSGRNRPPVAEDASLTLVNRKPVLVTGLKATDPDGTIASYTISTLPKASDGKLFLGNPSTGGTAIKAGRRLNNNQIKQLYFQPTARFKQASFKYTATDNAGAIDTTPARFALSLRSGSGRPGRPGRPEQPDIETPDDDLCEPGLNRKGDTSGNSLAGGLDGDRLIGFGGDDRLNGLNCRDRIDAGRGNDAVSGGSARDTIKGQQGSDNLSGDGGNDGLGGGLGSDMLSGGRGDDVVGAGRGNDRVMGGNGRDNARGDKGDDRINGGVGSDTITGNTGKDMIIGGQGRDNAAGGLGADKLNGGQKSDVLDGGRGNDAVYGTSGSDILFGKKGNDRLFGGTQADRLSGGDGDDILVGGQNADVLTGGAGKDQFVFRNISEAGDRITDFQVGQDKIVVQSIVRGSAYRSSNRFGSYVRIVQSGTDSIVRVDTNGDVSGGFRNLVTVLGVNADALKASSFVV